MNSFWSFEFCSRLLTCLPGQPVTCDIAHSSQANWILTFSPSLYWIHFIFEAIDSDRNVIDNKEQLFISHSLLDSSSMNPEIIHLNRSINLNDSIRQSKCKHQSISPSAKSENLFLWNEPLLLFLNWKHYLNVKESKR